MRPVTFALYFGNRGFFPEKLVAEARSQLKASIESLGCDTILMDAAATPYGAVESAADGLRYARWLEENRGKFDGVVLCLPNFGDETGAVAALRDARVPILIHAYPDDPDKMGFSDRRDAFCGKLSVMDVFHQYDIPFTALQPHSVHPHAPAFARNIHEFARTCRVVRGMRSMVVGAIGARTTAFKTVRFDEMALQRHGITTETLDLSEIIRRVRQLPEKDPACREKADLLAGYTDFSEVPGAAMQTLVKLSVVLDQVAREYSLDAMAIRCWLELEQELKVAPCVLVGLLNDMGIPCACEVDVCSAVAMHALHLASDRPATCLDWNNNYGEEEDKCILFHCGPVPQKLMAAKGQVIDHPMFAKVLGAGCGVGCNVGRLAASPMTFASTKTENGKLMYYLGDGEVTPDPIDNDYFGCAGVVRIADLQRKLQAIGRGGYRHHVSVTFGHVLPAVQEALGNYLGYTQTNL